MHQAAMKPGALSLAEKELIAISIGLSVRCENCIYAHIQAALNAGASREQIPGQSPLLKAHAATTVKR
jgi:AhpD family alkylhydroperoxidase